MNSRSNYNLSSLFILLFFLVNFVFSQSNGYKVVIDEVRRKAKGFIRINNKEKKIFLFDKA